MFIFEPDPQLIAQLEAEDTNVIAFPTRQTEHASDCAIHNEPAFPTTPCNCGAEPEGAA